MGYVRSLMIAYNRGRERFEQAASWSCKVISSCSRPRRLPRNPCCVLIGGCVALVGIAAGADSADTRTYREYRSKRLALTTPARPGEKAEREKPKVPPQAHLVIVSVPKQRISVYGAGGILTQGAVSTGMSGFPTPTGVFSVIQKNRYHRSNIYSGAPMPFMQRITWSGVAMHAGVLPGYPASHGCIRLTHNFASELWGMTRMGVRVIVAPEDVHAVEFAHPALPTPTLTPAPAPVANAEPAKSAVMTVSANDKPSAAGDAPPIKLLDPLERAKAARIQIVAEAPAKVKAAKEAVEASAARASEANKAIAALRDAEGAVAAAKAKLDAAIKTVEAAKTPEAIERAKSAQAAAEAKLEEATKVAAEAGALEAAKTQEAFAAARAAWDAEKASDAATAVIRAGERSTEPISVFVSKKAGRVYIRQAWTPIHEAPVAFKDPDLTLGTHVYVAVESTEDSKAMRWLSVSLAQPAAQSGRPRETAASVLERFELPPATKAFISDRLWAGASLIVSDQGISHETGKYTDFIVLSR
ncbi:MAG: L,D-transpeptidase [Alphaproteobacteria bacterium]|nr:MAG: L,D-transpeptidase [Alphaproteobacteria bacterium]